MHGNPQLCLQQGLGPAHGLEIRTRSERDSAPPPATRRSLRGDHRRVAQDSVESSGLRVAIVVLAGAFFALWLLLKTIVAVNVATPAAPLVPGELGRFLEHWGSLLTILYVVGFIMVGGYAVRSKSYLLFCVLFCMVGIFFIVLFILFVEVTLN